MKVTFKGNEITLLGNEIKVGNPFPEFTVTNNSLDEVSLKDTKGIRIFLTVPSIDTPVCDLEVKTFNKRAAELTDVTIFTVSMDLPFAQARWCGNEDINNVVTLSDYKHRSFGEVSGTFIKELGLLTRAAFVVDCDNIVKYVEYVGEVTDSPNFDAILDAAQNIK